MDSKGHRLAALVLVAVALLIYPAPVLVEALGRRLELPLTPLYAFGVWLALILAAALLVGLPGRRRGGRE